MENFEIDKVTGYLENNEESGIKPIHKTAFLKSLKTTGNQSSAASRLGFTWAEMEAELGKDLKFKQAYDATLLEMKHQLESILFMRAIEKKDAKTAVLWLQAKFPSEYRAGAKQVGKKDNKENLFDNLLGK